MSENIVFEWGQPILPEEAKLIGRVEAGELKPSEADAQRQEAGLPPLARWADPTGFDPRQRINWTLPMAISWIIWRTVDAVREEMPDYRSQSTFWNSRGEGTEASPTRWSLQQNKPRSVHSVVSFAPLSDRKQIITATSAESALLRMLQDESSALIATGLPSPGAPRDRISAEEWEDLTPFNDNRYYDGARAQNDSKPRWYEVRVKSADVMRLWPEVPTSDAPIAAEAEHALESAVKSAATSAIEKATSDVDLKAKNLARTAPGRQSRSDHSRARLETLQPHLGLLDQTGGNRKLRKISDEFQKSKGRRPLSDTAFDNDLAKLRSLTELGPTSVTNDRSDRTTEVDGSHPRD